MLRFEQNHPKSITQCYMTIICILSNWTTTLEGSYLNLQFLFLLVDLCYAFLEHWGWWQDPQWAHLQLFDARLIDIEKKQTKLSHASWEAINLFSAGRMINRFNIQERNSWIHEMTAIVSIVWHEKKLWHHHHQRLRLTHLPSRSPCCCSPCLTLPLRRRDSDLQPLWWSKAAADPAATGSWSFPCYAGAFLKAKPEEAVNRSIREGEVGVLADFSEYCGNLICCMAESVWEIRWHFTEGI